MNQRNRRKKRRSMSFVSKAIIFVIMVVCIFGVFSLVTNFIGNNNVGHAQYTGSLNSLITVYGNTGAGNTENNMPQRDVFIIYPAENPNSQTYRTPSNAGE